MSTKGNLWKYIIRDQKAQSFKASKKSDSDFTITFKKPQNVNLTHINNQWLKTFALSINADEGKTINFTYNPPTGRTNNSAKKLSKKINYIKNGSFELGNAYWGISYNNLDSNSFSVLSEANTQGSKSLKISLTESNGQLKMPNTTFKVNSEYIELPPRTKVTLAVDAKSSVKDFPVKLVINYKAMENVANAGTSQISKNIVLDNDWNRFSFSLRLPRAFNNAYSIGIESDKKNKILANIFLDGISLRAEDETNYTANKSLEIAGSAKAKHSLYKPGDQIRFAISAKNNSSYDEKLNARILILGPNYQQVYEQNQNISLNKNELNDKVFQNSVLNFTKKVHIMPT